MRNKIKKIIVLCCICCSIMSNTLMVQAQVGPTVEELQIDSDEWEKFILQIVEIKKENTDKTDEEIVKIISDNMIKTFAENKGISDIWNALTDAEKSLIVKYPFASLKVNDAKNIATEQTNRKFGHNGLGDRSDAFRHGIWNAEMTIMIGAEKAKLFADAHEDKDTTGVESDGNTKEEHKSMDLHNNGVGRSIGQVNLNFTEEQMSNYIYEIIFQENTPFIWLNE